MTKFAARFGYTRQALADSPELHRRVLERYAKDHGHDPAGLDEWTMIVSADGEVRFYPYYYVSEDTCATYGERIPLHGWTDEFPVWDPPLPLEGSIPPA